MRASEEKSIRQSTVEILRVAAEQNMQTAFDRADSMKKCQIGSSGLCCKNCAMGPCRLVGKDEGITGVCGASRGIVAARTLTRMIAGGAAAHIDHGREIAFALKEMLEGEAPDYTIKAPDKLIAIAKLWGVNTEDRPLEEIGKEVAEICISQFGQQDGEVLFTHRAPIKRQEIWRKLGIMPRGIDREVVEMMHRTHIGVDQDCLHVILQGLRTAVADGWGGSMIGTEFSDVLFGMPAFLKSKSDLGVLKEDMVNIIVHGHEPTLSDMIAETASDKELNALAKREGAKGINVTGMCCTGNEILLRHGIPVAGNFLDQETAIITGVVEAMIVDIQCVMQSVVQAASCFHTKIITTSDKARITGAQHIQFETKHAKEIAKRIIREAIDNFKNRDKSRVYIPRGEAEGMMVGFSHENILYMLGGKHRASYRPLNDAIIAGRIRGVVGVIGCQNARIKQDEETVELTRELIKNDVLVIQTGCSAQAAAKAGLLKPEVKEICGPGLREICEAVGIPPMLHAGSCVDNTRILVAMAEMVHEGGLGDDISDLPVAGVAPEWMAEKAIAIGAYFVASGCLVVYGGGTFPVTGSEEASAICFEELEQVLGGKFAVASNAQEIAKIVIEHIDKKRVALGIDKNRNKTLADIARRRKEEESLQIVGA